MAKKDGKKKLNSTKGLSKQVKALTTQVKTLELNAQLNSQTILRLASFSGLFRDKVYYHEASQLVIWPDDLLNVYFVCRVNQLARSLAENKISWQLYGNRVPDSPIEQLVQESVLVPSREPRMDVAHTFVIQTEQAEPQLSSLDEVLQYMSRRQGVTVNVTN